MHLPDKYRSRVIDGAKIIDKNEGNALLVLKIDRSLV